MQIATPVTATIVTDDLSRQRDFYIRHFGAVVAHDFGWYLILHLGGPDGPELSFMVPRNPRQHPLSPGGLTLNLTVPDADEAYRRLEASGVPLGAPPEDRPYGVRSFWFEDPQGVRLYISHPLPPR